MLKIRNLSVRNLENNRILDKVNLDINENEIHCLLGKNGSGKTTLAYAVMGLSRGKIESGKIALNGKDITAKKPYERAKAGLCLAFQEPAKIEGLSVGDFLLLGSGSGEKTKGHKNEELQKVLKLVGLEENILERKLDDKLSGGERKRIELASVIMMKPKLMILDEPDASLDIIVYNELYDLLLKIREELKCSILLITHREEAGLVADKASFIEKGRIVKSGRFREVMREYCKRMGRRDKCLAGRKTISN